MDVMQSTCRHILANCYPHNVTNFERWRPTMVTELTKVSARTHPFTFNGRKAREAEWAETIDRRFSPTTNLAGEFTPPIHFQQGHTEKCAGDCGNPAICRKNVSSALFQAKHLSRGGRLWSKPTVSDANRGRGNWTGQGLKLGKLNVIFLTIAMLVTNHSSP